MCLPKPVCLWIAYWRTASLGASRRKRTWFFVSRQNSCFSSATLDFCSLKYDSLKRGGDGWCCLGIRCNDFVSHYRNKPNLRSKPSCGSCRYQPVFSQCRSFSIKVKAIFVTVQRITFANYYVQSNSRAPMHTQAFFNCVPGSRCRVNLNNE